MGSWTVSGAVYGASGAAVQPQFDRIAQHFLASGEGRQIPLDEAEGIGPLHIAINSNTGVLTDIELKMLGWRPGGDAIWLSAGSPVAGEIVNRRQALARDICQSHGLEYLLSNVCGARFARAIHAIFYNREDAGEAARADACYRALAKLFIITASSSAAHRPCTTSFTKPSA